MHKELIVEYNYDFELMGITSSIKSHKIAWWLNKLLGIRLIRKSDIKLEFLDQSKVVVSNFLYKTEHSYIRLLKNASEEAVQGKTGFLLPEIKHFDYLIMLSGFKGEELNLPYIKEKLLRLNSVSDASEISVEKLTAKENLIF
jgi:hypothetical protein